MPVKKPNPKEIYKKLKLTSDLYDFAIKVKTFQLKKKFPTASDTEIKKRVLNLIEKGCK